jgi:hypothetical protein
MPSLPTALLNLILVSPFIAMTLVVIRGVRAVIKGEVSAGGRSGIRTHTRSGEPIAFWIEIGLHGFAAAFLFFMGLSLTGLAPDWVIEVFG